jgi:hypothetical protein
MLTCERMRTAVILSALLLVFGLLLAALARAIPILAPAAQIALFLVLAAMFVLGLTFLASLFPGTAERLKECIH